MIPRLIQIARDDLVEGSIALPVPPKDRFLALDRKWLYWNHARTRGPLSECQFLLSPTETGTRLWLPLVDGDLRAWMTEAEGEWSLHWDGLAPDADLPEGANLLLIADSEYEDGSVGDFIEQAFEWLIGRVGNFRIARDKDGFTGHFLGWCTWDAFYHEVDAQKVLEGVQSFEEGGQSLGWVLLDDGWLDTKDGMLWSFEANAVKFPGGLSSLSGALDSPLGVWHALQGYWGGVHPESPLAQSYRTLANTGNIQPWNDAERNLNLVHPDDAGRFYMDFHRHLSQQGVNFVKVDGQSALEVFTQGKLGRASSMARAQEALQASAGYWFGNRLIHCMSHGQDVLLNLRTTSTFRNSDDFFPNRPDSHGRHIYNNSMNALWSAPIAQPDWDMFWSGHPEGSFHAAARALSGGPIYVSDRPGTQDFDLLRRLADPDGRCYPCPGPALPTEDCLYLDPCANEGLLKIQNEAGTGGVVGVFHCGDAGRLVAQVEVDDIPHTYYREAIALETDRDGSRVLGPATTLSVELGPLEWHIIQFSELFFGQIAVLGRLDLLVPGATLTDFEEIADGILTGWVSPGTTTLWIESGEWEVTDEIEEVLPLRREGNLAHLERDYGSKIVIRRLG